MPRHTPARTRRIRRTAVVAGLATVALLVSSCSLFGSDDPEDGKERAERGAGVLVAVDGWSLEMMPSKLRWEADGRKGDVALEPATPADIDELLERDPAAVTQLAARLLTADPRLSCGTDGCEAGGGPLDLAGLTDVDAGPYGDVLAAAGVEHAVHVGFVPSEPGGPVQFSSGEDVVAVAVGGTAGEVPLPPGAPDPSEFEGFDEVDPEAAAEGQGGGDGVPSAPEPDDPMFEEDPADAAVDGPATEVVAIAAGAGRMFEPVAPWLTGEADEGPHPFGATDLAAFLTPAIGELTAPEGNGPLAAGLADADPAVTADLSPSQLSALTAPTTGCGVGVLCAPTAAGADIDTTAVDTARVCDSVIANPFASENVAESTAVLQLVTRTQVWTLNGGPRNQFGFWDTDPESPNVLFWPAAAPAVKGEVSRHVRTAELYDGLGRLLDISGEVTDDAEDWSADAFIAAHSDRFERCTEPPVTPPAGADDTVVYDVIPEI